MTNKASKKELGFDKRRETQTVIDKLPVVKDPFWPEGAAPLHLSVEQQQSVEIIQAYKPDWKCARCGSTSHKSKKDSSLCEPCSRVNAQSATKALTHNSNWMELAEEIGLEIFERQPEETDIEWRIWSTYRNYYPLKLPTTAELAARVGCGASQVVRAMSKWSYKVRLIAWARYTDADIQERRIQAVREMNTNQLEMAKTIQDKLKTAIGLLQPETLRPNELVNLFKVSTELERRVTEYVEERVESTATQSSTKQQEMTKPEDINEIVAILRQTGMLDNRTIGVETTTTTRVIAKED